MFIPLSDENQLRGIKFQFVTVGLIVANVLVFLWETSIPDMRVVASFAVVPNELLRVGVLGGPALGPQDAFPVSERYTLLSYMFFHGSWMHLGGNMLFLWVFGDNVEDAIGHFKYLLFYLACGVLAALAHVYMLPESSLPLIGASGAVAGVIAAYLMLHPRVHVWVLAFKFIPLRITALLALGVWIAMNFVMAMLPATQPIAWWAHVGGIVAGALLIIFMRRAGVPLFDKGLTTPA